MDKIKVFFENLVENHLGAMIALILAFVTLIVGAIVLSLKINRRKKERAEREYKEELSRISKEELDNIAGNVSNPEVLYKSFETAKTAGKPPLENGVDGDKNEASSEKPAAPTSETANSFAASKEAAALNDESAKAANETPAETAETAETAEIKTETQPAPQEVQTSDSTEPSKPAPSAKTAAKSASKSTAKTTAKSPSKSTVAKTDGKKATNKPAATSVTKTSDANKVAAAPTKPAKVAPSEQKTAQAHKQAYAGKWVIVKDEDGKYYAKLLASNGGVLLQTENYSSLSGVKNGIQTIKKNVDGGNFATSIDKYGHYRFKLFSMSNRLICQSEDYSSKAKCESGINSVKRFAKTELIINEID